MRLPQHQVDDLVERFQRNWKLGLLVLIGVLAMIYACVGLLGD
jgi:hypothetical protein